MESLIKLKEMLDLLPEGNNGEKRGCILELELLRGIGYSIGLLKNKYIAVAKTVVSEGALFAAHYHKEIEIITIYKGSLKLYVNATCISDMKNIEPILLLTGESFRIETNIPHIVEVINDSKLIAMSIPASKYFPDA